MSKEETHVHYFCMGMLPLRIEGTREDIDKAMRSFKFGDELTDVKMSCEAHGVDVEVLT